jgi:carbamoyl-phosphate synthase large subunit
MKEKINILITGVGSTTAISVIKGLNKQKKYDVNIIGTDMYKENDIAGSAFCDKFFIVPPANNEEEYISRLANIVDTESIDILIPIVDIELEVIAKHKKSLHNTFVLLSSYETVMTCNDKIKTYEFFNKFRIPTLKTILLEDFDNLNQKISDCGINYPMVTKPRKGVSSRDVYKINNIKENILIRRIDNPIIQENGSGEEYTIDIFGDGNRLISAVPRKRIEMRSGISYKGKTVKNDLLIKFSEKIYDKLRFIGPANFQCFMKDDEIKFFDINPRFSGSLPLTIAAGINTTLLALQLSTGEELEILNNFKEISMCRYWEEIYYE